MDLDIKTRHFSLGEEAREKIEAQFEKLERFSPRPVLETKLNLAFDNGTFACDAELFLRNHVFRASHGGAPEPELAAVGAAENLQRQLEKFKGKVSAKQRGETGGLGRAMVLEESPDLARLIETEEGFELRDMDRVAAQDAFVSSSAPFLVYRDTDTSRIAVVYRREDGEIGLMQARND
jgi:ribosomal subunit interface protein